MIKVRFLSFLAHNTGKKELTLDYHGTVSEVLMQLQMLFPSISDMIDPNDPSVVLIMDGKNLYLPKDFELIVMDELIISPIIAGG